MESGEGSETERTMFISVLTVVHFIADRETISLIHPPSLFLCLLLALRNVFFFSDLTMNEVYDIVLSCFDGDGKNSRMQESLVK